MRRLGYSEKYFLDHDLHKTCYGIILNHEPKGFDDFRAFKIHLTYLSKSIHSYSICKRQIVSGEAEAN